MSLEKSEKKFNLNKVYYGAAFGFVTGGSLGLGWTLGSERLSLAPAFTGSLSGTTVGVAIVVLSHLVMSYVSPKSKNDASTSSKFTTGNQCVDYMVKGALHAGVFTTSTTFGTISGWSAGSALPLNTVALCTSSLKTTLPCGMAAGAMGGLLFFSAKKLIEPNEPQAQLTANNRS